MLRIVEWLGSKKCDICGIECDTDLYDAVTKQGPWATMCSKCFKKYSRGLLGTGYGQHYQISKDGSGTFVKVEG